MENSLKNVTIPSTATGLNTTAISVVDDSFYTRNESEYLPYSQRVETYLVPVVFAMIFLLGVIGNGVLVLVFVRNKNMRKGPNTFIFSLALADLLVILICVPFVSVIYTVETWPWGAHICKISETAKDISIGVSEFTLMALAAERYCAIANPFKKIRFRRLPLLCFSLIWSIASILAIPAAIMSDIYEAPLHGNVTVVYCTPYPTYWPSYGKWMTVAKFLVYYLLPLVVIAVFYTMMALRLLASTREMPGALHGEQGEAQNKARRSVAVMVITFILVFFVCFLPHHICELWFYLSPDAQENYDDYVHFLRIFAFCLSFLNSCVNPIALFFVSKVFRQYFKNYLLCRHKPLQPTHSTRLSRTAVCETSFRSTYRQRCNNNRVNSRNPTESVVVISNYEYGVNKNQNKILMHRNSVEGITIVTFKNPKDYLTGDQVPIENETDPVTITVTDIDAETDLMPESIICDEEKSIIGR